MTTDWPKKQLLPKPKKQRTTDWPKKQLLPKPKKQMTPDWPKKQLKKQLQSHCQEGRVKRGWQRKVKLQMFRHMIDVKGCNTMLLARWTLDKLQTSLPNLVGRKAAYLWRANISTCTSDVCTVLEASEHLLCSFAFTVMLHISRPHERQKWARAGCALKILRIPVEANLDCLRKDSRLWQEPQDCFEHVRACETTS